MSVLAKDKEADSQVLLGVIAFYGLLTTNYFSSILERLHRKQRREIRMPTPKMVIKDGKDNSCHENNRGPIEVIRIRRRTLRLKTPESDKYRIQHSNRINSQTSPPKTPTSCEECQIRVHQQKHPSTKTHLSEDYQVPSTASRSANR